jgi:hypothetical protein
VLGAAAASVLAVVPGGLLAAVGLGLLVTGAIGHCLLCAGLASVPRSLRRSG